MVVPELPQSIARAGTCSRLPVLAVDAQRVAVTTDSNAQLAKRRTVRELSSPPDKFKYSRRTIGDAAKDNRAMGNRLIARHGDIAVERMFDRVRFVSMVREFQRARQTRARIPSPTQRRFSFSIQRLSSSRYLM